MKNMTMLLAVIAGVLASTLLSPSSARAQSAPVTYKAKCAGCHGADGKASTGAGKALGAHDFGSEEVAKMSDADLIKTVTDGKNKMPAYGKSMKDPEIKDLVAYIRELSKQK
ncbi:MAG TPA: cytochrome c [Candidatus Polarisedimenticolia bacterium]|nr:cytochrome c [Candidatus Polarisedimenticolia bacterium]